MLVNLSIKSVPEQIAQRLRARAERNHRSLQGELMAIVERAAAAADSDGDDAAGAGANSLGGWTAQAPSAAASRLVGVRRGSKSIEQLAAAHRALYPEPFQDLPLAVDIIRQERDAR